MHHCVLWYVANRKLVWDYRLSRNNNYFSLIFEGSEYMATKKCGKLPIFTTPLLFGTHSLGNTRERSHTVPEIRVLGLRLLADNNV